MRSGRPNWSRPLPPPLVIPDVMTLKTLADVRELIEPRLPQHFRDNGIWHYVAATLRKAAQDRVATAEVNVALVNALELERSNGRRSSDALHWN
jgi:hypothetical protein